MQRAHDVISKSLSKIFEINQVSLFSCYSIMIFFFAWALHMTRNNLLFLVFICLRSQVTKPVPKEMVCEVLMLI